LPESISALSFFCYYTDQSIVKNPSEPQNATKDGLSEKQRLCVAISKPVVDLDFDRRFLKKKMCKKNRRIILLIKVCPPTATRMAQESLMGAGLRLSI